MSELKFKATGNQGEQTLEAVPGAIEVSGVKSSSQLLFLPAAKSVTLRADDLSLFTYMEPPGTGIVTDSANNVSQRSTVYVESHHGTACLFLVAAKG